MKYREARDLVDRMSDEHGVTAVIAGGFARAKYFDKEAKDIDIILISDDLDKVRGILSDVGLKEVNVVYDDTDERIAGLWQLKAEPTDPLSEMLAPKDYDIDVIVYKSELFIDVYDVVINGFDVNMNQFTISNLTGYPIGLAENHDKVVRYINNDISDNRRKHLINIAKDLGWDYSCLEQTIQ